MASHCSVCVSPFREVVERGLRDGAAKAEMARRLDLNRRQIYRHAEAHMNRPVVEVLSEDLIASVIPRLEKLVAEVDRVKDSSTAKGKDQIVLQAVRVQRELLNDIARLRGEIPLQRIFRLDEIPGWAVALQALDAHPQARLAVARALKGSA